VIGTDVPSRRHAARRSRSDPVNVITPSGADRCAVGFRGHLEPPASFVDQVVVRLTQRCHAVDIGGIAARPRIEVVDAAVVDRHPSVGMGAGRMHGSSLRGRNDREGKSAPAESKQMFCY